MSNDKDNIFLKKPICFWLHLFLRCWKHGLLNKYKNGNNRKYLMRTAAQIKSVTKRGERSDQRECGGGIFYT